MSSNTFLVDAASRRAALLQRYSAGLEKSMADRVADALKAAAIDVITIEGSDGKVRLETVNNYRGRITTAEAELWDELLELAIEEGEFSTEMFEEAISADIEKVPDIDMTAQVSRAQIDVLPGQRVTIPSMLSQFTEAKAKQINAIIQDGFTEGLTQQQMVSRILEVEPLQRRQAASLARTGSNAVSSIARYSTMSANSDVLLGYEWVATLDDRTSLVCASRDGMVYPFSETSPKPPAHFSACPQDTMITTKRGMVPIQDVKVGDLVMTHAGRWKPVTCVMAKPHKGKIKTLVDNFGNRVSLTDEHPVLTELGYVGAVDLDIGHNVFNYRNKLSSLKHWLFGALVKDRVLIDSHNLETETTERLVAYTVTSFSAGVSSAINLNNNIADNEVANVPANNLLKLIPYAQLIKNIFHKVFVKCRVFK